MRLSVCLVLLVALGLAVGSTPAAGQTASATLNGPVIGLARLTLSSAAVTFPDADPDSMPNVAASQGPITVTAKARTMVNGRVTLTVLATGPLRSGLNTIPASNVTWTASGAGFSGGTLNASAAQTVGAWNGSGARTGTQMFFFKNLWTYATGTYSLTMTFTLTAA
ncbi:MAG: hypothetical protein ABI603_02715 [Acidobacteriota bacterium]